MKATFKKYPQLKGFFQFDSFNHIQTACLSKIMEEKHNIIVSAPTSSGKTVLFEFAILKYSHLSNPMCLYLAPIKSLCHEKYNNWQKKFGKNLSVVEVTGDSLQNSQQKYFQSHIVIGTPEKLDYLSRQNLEFLKKIKLLLIDQIHMLNFEERGATLEAIVSRIMSLNSEVRILAVSATIPNITEVAQWLKVPKEFICVFGQQFRPVKINRIVLGFKSASNPFTFERSLNFKLIQAIRLYSDGKGSLIFCPTQKGTESACQQIISMMRQRQFIENDKQLTILVQAAKQVSNSTLQIMIPQGIAFHNASLSPQDRNIVERLFLELRIRVLCTTSTLSMGINLPARLVIIKSTQSYKGSMRGYQEYTRIQMDQMIGRAGRPPFDTEGTVVIMTQKINYQRYNNKLDLQNLESQLFSQMLQHLNAQISLGSINSLNDVYQYIHNSFCYIRMKKSPLNYGITGNIDQYIQISCKKAIQNLASLNIIALNLQIDRLYPRPLSHSISRSAIEIKSIAYISKMSSEIKSERQFLYALCSCQQIGRYSSKLQQRKTLKQISEKNKYPIKQAVSNSQRKSFVLVQAQLSKKQIDFWELRRQASDILTLMRRLNYCVKVLGSQLKHFWIFYWALRFQKYFVERYWEGAEQLVLLQFSGLQDKHKLLNLRGIKNLIELKKNLANISIWLQKGSAFQAQILDELRCYQKPIQISFKIQQNQKQCAILRLKVIQKFTGKLKGIHICIGDNKNNLYCYKYIGQHAKQISVNFPKSGGNFKIGIIKEGIIGFDQFYILEGQTLIQFQIDRQFQKKGPSQHRKSVDNIKNGEFTTIKQKKSKSHQIRKSFNENLTSNIKKKMKQYNQSIKKKKQQIQIIQFSPQQKQLKLPPSYQIKQPAQLTKYEDHSMIKKQIKRDNNFRYKPLDEYKWKPGFPEISSSSQQSQINRKPLKIVDTKTKPNSKKCKNMTNVFNSTRLQLPKYSKNKSSIGLNSKANVAREQEDVFAYFYNLF